MVSGHPAAQIRVRSGKARRIDLLGLRSIQRKLDNHAVRVRDIDRAAIAVLEHEGPRRLVAGGREPALVALLSHAVDIQRNVMKRGRRHFRTEELLVFGFWFRLLPQGYMTNPTLHDYFTPWGKFLDVAKHLVLPAATLTLITIAAIARYQRAAMLEVLPADYIRTARAKGLPERAIVWRHALRNALTPMITVLGLLFPVLLGGALFVEKVFSWPGMGDLTARAIEGRDYDLVTASVIVGSVMVVVGNLIADLLQAAVDPRVRE